MPHLKINILHIIVRLPIGGVEQQLLNVVMTYNKNKYNPIVCCIAEKGEIGEEIEKLGFEIMALHRMKHHRFDPAIVFELYKVMKAKNIKIVRTHQYHANLYGRLAAYLAKVPCIVASVHNVYTRDKKFHRRIINKYLARFTDKVIAVSETVKKDIIRYDGLYEDKIMVIYNGIDMDGFLNVNGDLIRSELGISSKVPVIGTIGRLTFQKGQKYLIDAISKLRDKFPQIVLLIVGDGPLRDELENYARTLGIMGNAIFLGTRRDIPSILSSMDIFVLPSLWEGLSNALIEAMASGKPIIATDISQNREILGNIGVLIPPKNSDAIATSIELLFDNSTLSENLGKTAKQRAFSSFNIESTVDAYTNLFEYALNYKLHYNRYDTN